MTTKSLYRTVVPEEELALVKESFEAKTSPIVTLGFQAGFIFVALFAIHFWDAFNMRICQCAEYFLILTLLASVILYSYILCLPISDTKRSKIMIYLLSFSMGAVYIILSATYFAGVAILTYLFTFLYVAGLLFVANIIGIDITGVRSVLMISFGILTLCISLFCLIFGLITQIPLVFFIGAVCSLLFTTFYLFVNCQYCGLYVGKKTKVRKITMENTYEAHPVAYLYVGSLTIALQFQPIIHQLWKYCEGKW